MSAEEGKTLLEVAHENDIELEGGWGTKGWWWLGCPYQIYESPRPSIDNPPIHQ